MIPFSKLAYGGWASEILHQLISDRWPTSFDFVGVSTILLVMQDFFSIHSSYGAMFHSKLKLSTASPSRVLLHKALVFANHHNQKYPLG